MTDARTYLAGIKERAAAATAGPWFAEGENSTGARTVYYVFHNGDTPDRDKIADSWGPDAEFIAHSRTDVPKLIAALEAVWVLADEHDAECQRIGDLSWVPSGRIRKAITEALEASL